MARLIFILPAFIGTMVNGSTDIFFHCLKSNSIIVYHILLLKTADKTKMLRNMQGNICLGYNIAILLFILPLDYFNVVKYSTAEHAGSKIQQTIILFIT